MGDDAAVPGSVDFFVSYTSADRPWAEWIAWELEHAGHSVIVQAWDMEPGANFVLQMDEAAHVAERTIAVLSPAFAASPYCRAEWAAAFRKDPTGAERRLVPVRVREFEPDGLLGQMVYVDIVGLTETASREALLTGVASTRSKPRGAPTFPGLRSRRERDRERVPRFPTQADPAAPDALSDRARTVMVVYGRDADARRALFDMLRAVGLRPQEWTQLIRQTATGAPYAGEVLDRALELVQAVIVLMTPDDEARLCPAFVGEDVAEAELRGQPRPNVLFEAGLAFGRVPSHTILVSLGELRGLSDLSGRQMVRLDDGQTALHDLVQRLRNAGCEVDTTGTDWLDRSRFRRATPSSAGHTGSTVSGTANCQLQVQYLQEDAQRWVRDRDDELIAKINDATSAMAERGLERSSILLVEIVRLRREALRQYRDEMTSLRRRYNEICAPLAPTAERPRLSLDRDSLARLDRWRSAVQIPGLDVGAEIDDPTDASLEPDLRRFEAHGDPA